MTGEYFSQRQDEILTEIADADMRGEDAHTEILKTKKQLIKEWEERCVKEVERGVNPDLTHVSEISAYITRKLKETKRADGEEISASAIRHIQRVLEPEHKRDYEKQAVDNGDGTISEMRHMSQSSADDELKLPRLKPIEKLTHDDAVEVAKLVKQAKEINQYIQDYGKKAQEKADESHWTDVKIAKLKSTGPDLPESRRGPYHETLRNLGQAILDFADKVEKYPPTPEDEDRYRQATEPFLEFMRFLNDEKFNQSAVAWMETIETMEGGAKHAAAVLHGTNARIKEFYDDEETGETKYRWVEVPRNFTREQVGDQREGVLDLAISIIQNEGVWHAMADCKDRYAYPYLAGRKVKMHEEFSEKA